MISCHIPRTLYEQFNCNSYFTEHLFQFKEKTNHNGDRDIQTVMWAAEPAYVLKLKIHDTGSSEKGDFYDIVDDRKQ